MELLVHLGRNWTARCLSTIDRNSSMDLQMVSTQANAPTRSLQQQRGRWIEEEEGLRKGNQQPFIQETSTWEGGDNLVYPKALSVKSV